MDKHDPIQPSSVFRMQSHRHKQCGNSKPRVHPDCWSFSWSTARRIISWQLLQGSAYSTIKSCQSKYINLQIRKTVARFLKARNKEYCRFNAVPGFSLWSWRTVFWRTRKGTLKHETANTWAARKNNTEMFCFRPLYPPHPPNVALWPSLPAQQMDSPMREPFMERVHSASSLSCPEKTAPRTWFHIKLYLCTNTKTFLKSWQLTLVAMVGKGCTYLEISRTACG